MPSPLFCIITFSLPQRGTSGHRFVSNAGKGCFEAGRTDTLYIETEDLGPLTVTVGHDGSAWTNTAWHCEQVRVCEMCVCVCFGCFPLLPSLSIIHFSPSF